MRESISQFGTLRSIQDEELELMLSWRNEPVTRQNMYTNHEITLTEHLAWWEDTKASAKDRYFMYEFAGRPEGIVGFNRIDRTNRNASWAFYSSPGAPKGTGSRMEILALDYAFNEMSLHKLYCEVLAFNSSVIKLHQKFGFRVEGILRDQYRRDDHYIDIYRLGLLAPEWAGVRQETIAKLILIAKGRK